MRTAIVIPARLGATRLPRKPLADLGGKPLIVRTACQAKKSQLADLVVIATDDRTIAQAVEKAGFDVIMTPPECASGTDRVALAATKIDAELLVNLQGDEPFIVPDDLDTVITGLQMPGVAMATLKTPITNLEDLVNPSVVKVVTRDDQTALYFSRAPIPFERAQSGSYENTFRHIGVYGYRREALLKLSQTKVHPLEQRESLEQLRALAMGLSINVLMAKSEFRGIDTPEDLTWAKKRVFELGELAFP